MPPRPAKFTDQLRRAIDASGMSRYAICKAIDLDQPTMSRFMSRQCGLSCDTLDRLMKLLDLRLVAGRPAAAKTTKTTTKGNKK